MAANTIKGLTVEIGGDTTKLGKALEDVNKKSADLSSELGDINRLLKLDPGNVDLLSQKQKVLGSALENTKQKLDKLKEAEAQVQKQFERGEATEAQVRALKREIIATEKKVGSYEKAIEETNDALQKHGKASKDAEKAAGDLGGKLASVAKAGFGALTAAAGAALGGLVASAEATREYRTDMGKLDTAFTTAGHSSEAATKTYQALQGVLGDSAQAVEAANHLALLANNEQDLAKWTDIATGVYATFGASLPIENITEAANETAKTGAIVGGLADALNWAGVSEEEFQAKLDACTTEQERQALITETLNNLYGDAAAKYRETNAEVIRANEANEAWTASMAEAGAAVEPILTDVKMLGASLLSDFLPGITQLTEAFRGLLNGEDGAADAIGEALSGIISQLLQKITELAPTVAQVGISLLTTLVTTLISMLPQLVTTLIAMVASILDGLADAVPLIIQAVVALIPQLVQALVSGIPQLIQGALTLLLAIVDAIPLLLEELLPQIPTIITAIVDGLLDNVGLLFNAAVTLFFAIVKAIPKICLELVKALPQIWSTIHNVMKELPAKMMSIGSDLVKGLWNGIKDMVGWLKKKISGFADDVLEGIKNFFGVHSPSTETAWMGKMLSEGLAQGITDNADAPLDAMSGLASDLLDEENALNGLSIDRKLNATFGAESVGSSNSLLGKLDSILAAIERGQVIAIDGDALVGATVDKFDSKLGQRRVLAARGAL